MEAELDILQIRSFSVVMIYYNCMCVIFKYVPVGIQYARIPGAQPGLPGPTFHSTKTNTGRARDRIVLMRPVEPDEVEEEDEWEYQDESEVYLRSKFFESWLWKDINLPAQADKDG